MKYIAMSDLHLGQTGDDNLGELSLLSVKSQNQKANEKIGNLVDAVNEFFDENTSLILVGDVLDLSLSHLNTALMDLFLLLVKLPKFKEIIYIVGNHDHHLWTMHSEYKNFTSPLTKNMMPNSGSPYIRTSLMGEKFNLLEGVIGNNITIAYPMYKLPTSKVYFTHGHLFGGLYTLVSDILKPFLPKETPYLDAIPTVNLALIEFIYWLIGQIGYGMGANGIVEAIYTDTEKGKKSLLYQALKNAVRVLLPDGIIRGIPDSWERYFVRLMGKGIIDEFVKKPRKISSMDRHMPSEKNRNKALSWVEKTINEHSVLVSGHTHRSDHFNDFENGCELYNLGGWLMSEKDPDPDTNILLIDGNKITLKRL